MNGLWRWWTQLIRPIDATVPETPSREEELRRLEARREQALKNLDAEIRLTRARRTEFL